MLTVTTQEAILLPPAAVAVMVTVPALIAFKHPEAGPKEDTATTLGFEDVHVTDSYEYTLAYK